MPDLSERKRTGRFEVRPLCLWLCNLIAVAACLASAGAESAPAASHAPCRMQPAMFEGWKAEELSNDWVHLTVVPQLGGRLMQVEFGGHRYLFVNPQYKGKYFPPVDSVEKHKWINYGGDKLWPLPEGDGKGEWPGPVSDVLDDGDYKLSVVSQNDSCMLRLEGPADAVTGLQYSREISIGSDSPQISFHAVMRNATDYPIEWSVQSVTQYDTSDGRDSSSFNRDFWAFAPVKPKGAYADGYRVRNGLADDPSYEVREGMFRLHWLYLENEVWLDSDAGWLAVVDDAAKFGMVERYRYFAGEEYPGKASVIFYKNGAALTLDEKGTPVLRSNHPEEDPFYMEAEINSPMERLDPGASYAFDSWWFPVRAGKELKAVTSAGIVERPLEASLRADQLQISGSFGVFFAGKLNAYISDGYGAKSSVVELEAVDPLRGVDLKRTLRVSAATTRVAIHLMDEQGNDRGSLGDVEITKAGKDS